MQVKIAAVADYASISEERKLNILGIFSQISATEVPCTQLQMAVVVQFEFEPAETGHRRLGVEIRDEDGQLLLSVDGEGDVPRSPDAEPTVVNQIINLQAVIFPRFGQYDIRVLIDGEPVQTIPFRVVRTSNPNPPGV